MCGCLSHAPHWEPGNPGMCPDWESNQQPFGSQARTQSTEPHQPGPSDMSKNKCWLCYLLDQVITLTYKYNKLHNTHKQIDKKSYGLNNCKLVIKITFLTNARNQGHHSEHKFPLLRDRYC